VVPLEPLEQWICDTCGHRIHRREAGWLQWLVDDDDRCTKYAFRIVHHLSASPKHGSHGCYYGEQAAFSVADVPLPYVLGVDGLAHVLSFLTDGAGVRDVGAFVEIIRRCHLPYYEEARGYLARAEYDGVIESAQSAGMYTQDVLRYLVARYTAEGADTEGP
jgi:hypothetical protein